MRVEIKVDSLAICQHLGKFSSNFNFNWLFEENTGSNSQEEPLCILGRVQRGLDMEAFKLVLENLHKAFEDCVERANWPRWHVQALSPHAL